MDDQSEISTVLASCNVPVKPARGKKRKNSADIIDDNDEYKPLIKAIEARSTPPIKFIDEKGLKRPLLYSENSYGLHARGRHTNHLTIECLVSIPAQLFMWDDALGGFLPFNGYTICNVNLLQQITCQQTLSPSLGQPSARNSWSADDTNNNNELLQNTLLAPSVTKVTPIWEYSIQCQRKSDSKTIIECQLVPHMTYICALPTFHHWRISDKKFALSFGNDYNASKFHNRLQKALSHLTRQSKSTIAGSGESNLDAPDDLDDDVFVATDETPSATTEKQWPNNNLVYSPSVCPSVSITNHLNEEVPCTDEDTVPPLCSMLPSTHFDDTPPSDPESARSLGTSLSLATVSPCVNCQKCYGSPTFISSLSSEDPSLASIEFKKATLTPKNSDKSKPKLVQSSSSGACSAQEKSSLKFAKMRSIRSSSNPGSIMLVNKLSAKSSRDSEIAKSKSLLEAHLRNTYSSTMRNASFELIQRERCKYCNQWYNVKDNKRGDCPDAPDTVERWINRVTLYSWANTFINKRLNQRQNDSHCESSCFINEGTPSFRRKLWFTLLSCVFPCLCLYHPLTRIYHSRKLRQICSCCRVCSPIPSPKAPHPEDVLSTRRRRNRRPNAAKHIPVAHQTTVKSQVGSRRRLDQMNQQSSRTSSSQQILNDSYLNFKTASNYGSLLHQSIEGGNTIIDKPSTDSSKTDNGIRKKTRPLNSRLSF